ncbi:MAG TPA: toll/interleukin-1 receptor domain-containing protein [Burkholderiaceae bacterium]
MSDDRAPIFISHISGEADMAALLRQLVDEDFPGRVEFFTSTDVGSINTGADWLKAITRAIERASTVIVLCSRDSVHKPWVQFELGAAWIKGVPIIPVCHSGLKVDALQEPLSRLQGLELGTELGLERLFQGVSKALGIETIAPTRVQDKLARIAYLEGRFKRELSRQFELYMDIVVAAPGRLASPVIPDDSRVESDADSLELFGLAPDANWTWKDIVEAAQKTTDRRWLGQLQEAVFAASNSRLFKPVQAIYHAERASYQPQLARRESLQGGACRFHIHFVETTVAPLFEVQNDFGLLATLLRLGLRFRYEVIERAQRLTDPDRINPKTGQTALAELLAQLRGAIEVIETDALSRGAENISRDAVLALFNGADADAMAEVQQAWDESRALLFRTLPPLSAAETNEAIARMRWLNARFMVLGTRRFHEMVKARWGAAPRSVRNLHRAA